MGQQERAQFVSTEHMTVVPRAWEILQGDVARRQDGSIGIDTGI
jgi:hypothetical protein